MEPERDFLLGDWHVQPNLNKITCNATTVALEHRVMRVLVCLANHAPHPVSRDFLLEHVWPDAFTSEHSLTTAISELRKVFQDHPQSPQMIETIRKVGYRLMVEPNPVPQAQPKRMLPPKQPLAARHRRIVGLAALFAAVAGMSWWHHRLRLREGAAAPMLPQPLSSRPLTSYPGGEFDAYPNPQGTALAFVWSGEEKNFDIYVKDLNGEIPRRLTQKQDFDGSPVWSPDGNAIAFMGSNGPECGVYILSLTGGDTQKVADCSFHDESALDWSPDGRFLVFTDRDLPTQPSHLKLLDLTTGTTQALTHPPTDMVGDRDPCFSPDGQTLAFVRGTLFSTAAPEISQFYGDIFTLDLATHTLHQVTHENVEIPGLTWTADGKNLIFASNRDGGDYSLWSIGLSGGAPRHLLRGRDLLRNPMTLPHSQEIIFEDWERDTNIWRMQLRGPAEAEAKPFIQSTRWDSHPEYSPDGSRIAFTSQRSGTTEIWTCDASGHHPQKLTHFNGAFVNAARWSPDGQQLAYEVRDNSQAHIYIQSLRPHSQPQKITQGETYHLAPNWSQDGKSLYFGSNRQGKWQVWKQTLTETESQLMTPDGGFYACEWGESLYFTDLSRPGIWRMPLTGGPVVQVIERTVRQDWDNWTLRPQGLYFVRRLTLRKAAICFYPFPEGPEVELVQFDTHRVLDKNGLTVSPDGNWVLFTKLDRLSGDIMLTQGLDLR